MEKKETILLDARLKSVIDNNAFDAELRNGHRFVVTVEMSPYDMSKGRLVLDQEQ